MPIEGREAIDILEKKRKFAKNQANKKQKNLYEVNTF